MGAAEAAFAMTEEFAFHEFGRNGAAVHRYERFVDARTLLVDQPRYKLLAAARLTADVDRRLAAGQLADLTAQGTHCQRVAQQAVVDAARGLRAGQAQRAIDQLAQPAQVDRLGHKVESSGLQRVDRGVQVAVGSDHRHRHVGVAVLYVLHQLKAIAVRQTHVGQAHVERFAGQPVVGFGNVTRTTGVEFHASQRDLQEFANIRLIIDYQDFLPLAHAQLVLNGWAKVMRRQLPPVGRGAYSKCA